MNNLLNNKKINKFVQTLVSIFVLNSKKRKTIRKNLKERLKNKARLAINRLINVKYSDCYCFFSRYGIGDIFFIASLIKEFKANNNNAKVVYFTEKKHLVPYLKAFSAIDEVVYDSNFSFLQDEQFLQRKPEIGILNLLFFPYKGTKKTYTFADNYTNLLSLPLNSTREMPSVSAQNFENAKNEFERLGLTPEKTIVLIPEATMFDYRILSPNFWKNLANKLESMGYNVVFNSLNKEYEDYNTTFLPIIDFLIFASKTRRLVSFRSGINDLLVGCGLKNLTVLYPPNLEVIWAEDGIMENLNKNHIKKYDNEFENVFNIYSLNSNFNRNDIKELIYNYNQTKLENDILKSIQQGEK
ncbi:MAG: hypothetical protein IJW73_08845 [Candidatus Gastranaerophilales bacterium]|nr:hypothetical protein [Candidatus Gastranaerophilales bacterium]